MKVKAFWEISSFDFPNILSKTIENEINNESKERILGMDEDEYVKYLVDKFTVEPLVIHFDKEIIDPPKKKKDWVDSFRGRFEVEVYEFTISYPFQGDSILFKVQPSTFKMLTSVIEINEKNSTVSLFFQIEEQSEELFNRKKEECRRTAFANFDKNNILANEWNANLKHIVSNMFKLKKDKYLKENNFFAAIKVNVNKNTESLFSVPSLPKKTIPKPIPDKKRFSSEPTINEENYIDILKIIDQVGKSIEKKPSLYRGKDEESLRDQFLLFLETRYEATTATGETFNKGGKTDILLKYAVDGSNLFIAECKFWRGSEEFSKAISQLFDRYLTWRDSKTALIFFVKTKDFSKVLNTIKIDVCKHPYFKKNITERGESSFSYLFGLPQDMQKNVYLEIMAFHFVE